MPSLDAYLWALATKKSLLLKGREDGVLCDRALISVVCSYVRDKLAVLLDGRAFATAAATLRSLLKSLSLVCLLF